MAQEYFFAKITQAKLKRGPECPALPCTALPPALWLPTMARAVQLSVLHAGGMLEPFYQLHAQRLKLLLSNEAPNLACLTTIARQDYYKLWGFYSNLTFAPEFNLKPAL